MKSNRIVFALGAALVASLAVTACKKQEEAAPTPAPATVAAPAPATVETPAAAPTPATSFTVTAGTPKDKISVAIATDASVPANASLEASLTYVKADGSTLPVNKQSATIAAAGTGTTNIEFTKKTPWPTGKYSVAVTVNGTAVGTPQDVEIK